MSTYAIPSWWRVANFEAMLVPQVRTFSSPYGGAGQALDLLGERWEFGVELPGCKRSAAAQQEAFFNALRGPANLVSMHHFARPVPQGSVRGSLVLASSVAQGGNTLALSGARGGRNLLRRSDLIASFGGVGWSGNLCTITPNAVAAPDGTTTGNTITSTGAGNFFASNQIGSSYANRTFSFSIWLRSGTHTGNVTLRIRDGAGTEVGAVVAAMTTSWARFEVSGTFGASPASNVVFFIDPDPNAVGAGETLHFWAATYDLQAAQHINAGTLTDQGTDPAGGSTALTLLRTSVGAHYIAATYATTAHANAGYTASVYIKAGTLTGNVDLVLADGAGNVLALTTATPTGAWQRVTVSGTFGASPAANINVFLDPLNDAGSAGDTLSYWGLMLETGPSATAYTNNPTLLAGDMLGHNGEQLFQVAADASADPSGAITVATVNRARKAIASGQAISWDKPTTTMRLADSAGVPRVYAVGDYSPGLSLRFVESWA